MSERKINSQSSLEIFRNDGDDADRYYLPLRAPSISINRPEDLVLLPDTSEVRNYSKQLGDIADELNMQLPGTVFIPDVDYLLDVAIALNLSVLTSELSRDESFKILPYANTKHLRTWVDKLNADGYKLSISFPPTVYFEDLKNPQHRGGWGRWIKDPDIPSFPERHGISYPVSYIGEGLDEIKEARNRVRQESGKDAVFVKPLFSAGGFTLGRVETEEELENHYELLTRQGSLELWGREMPIEIQEEIGDVLAFGSLQYNGESLLTPSGASLQMMDGNNWGGNIFNGDLSLKTEDLSEDLFRKFTSGIAEEKRQDFYGWGGLDVAIVNNSGNDEVVVLEHNGARVTGAHPAIALAEAFEVSAKPFLIRKTQGNPACDLETVWKMLKSENISYDPNKNRGIFPLLWVDGCGFFFAVGDSENEILNLTEKSLELTDQNGYLT